MNIAIEGTQKVLLVENSTNIDLLTESNPVQFSLSGVAVAGPQGATGATGPKGDTGNTGSQGPSGVIAVTSPITNSGNSTSANIGINVGTTSETVAAGNDSRLSDSRIPRGSAGGDLTGTYPNPTLAFTGYDYEIHVSQVDGNDITGNGDLLKPVASITKALTLVGLNPQRKTIIVHPGTYTENPSITTQYTTITGPGLIGGNIVISGTVSTSVGCTIAGIKMTNLTVTTPASTGNVNILNCEVSGTFTKSSNADYTVLRLCDLNAANITGAGLVAIFGGNPNFVTVNNASANVIVKSAVTVSPVLTAGNANFVDSIVISVATQWVSGTTYSVGNLVYNSGNTYVRIVAGAGTTAPAADTTNWLVQSSLNGVDTTYALTSAAGTFVTLANSQFIVPAFNNVAKVALNGVYSIFNCVYDKLSSDLVAGGTTNSIDYFQHINADKFITQGGTSSQFVKGDGSLQSNVAVTDLPATQNTIPVINSKTGEWIPTWGSTSASGTASAPSSASANVTSGTNNYEIALPFAVAQNISISQIGNIAGTVTGTVTARFGIRNDDGTGRPGTLIAECSTGSNSYPVTLATNTAISGTFSSNQSLKAYTLYWLIVSTQGTGTVAWRYAPSVFLTVPLASSANTPTGAPNAGFYGTGSSSTLSSSPPATWTAATYGIGSATPGSLPAIAVRVA